MAFGGTTTRKMNFGGTSTSNVPPFGLGCQCSLLALPATKTLDLPMKKAARWSFLAALVACDGGAGGN